MGQFRKLTYCFHLMMASQPKVNNNERKIKRSHITASSFNYLHMLMEFMSIQNERSNQMLMIFKIKK